MMCYESKMSDNKILGDESTFKNCLRDVKEEMELGNIADIHMMMMYELSDTTTKSEAHSQRILSDRKSYAFYESVYDSMTLMDKQYQEMKKDRRWFKDKYGQLTF